MQRYTAFCASIPLCYNFDGGVPFSGDLLCELLWLRELSLNRGWCNLHSSLISYFMTELYTNNLTDSIDIEGINDLVKLNY